MLVGIVAFIFAALIVSAHGPAEGLSFGLGWLPAIVYVLGFHLLQSQLARWGRALVLREAKLGSAPPSRPYLLIIFQLVGLLAALQLGWSQYVQSPEGLGLGEAWLLPGLLMFLPFFLVHLSWLAARRKIREALEPDPWPLGSYLAFHVRILVIPLLPCLVNSTLVWLQQRPGLGLILAAFPSLELVGALASGVLILVLSPYLMRLALRSRSLEGGPLRRSLEDVARSGGFRMLDIRVAETHGRIINALFVGVLGRQRYVFLTDGLLARLSQEDLRGVFAHEMAHSRRGHIILNMALLLGFSLMLTVLATGFADDSSGSASLVLGLVGLPVFFLFVFAPLMRTWETEADVHSGEILGDPGPIKRALTELGRLHPKRMREGGVTHPAIEQRLAFIDSYFREPSTALEFNLRLRRLRRRVATFFFVALGLWLVGLPLEIAQGRIREATVRAEREEDLPLAEETLARLEDWNDRYGRVVGLDADLSQRAALWTTLASGYQKTGALERAAPHVASMRDHLDQFGSDPVKLYNVAVLQAQQDAGEGRFDRMLGPLRRSEQELDRLEAMVVKNGLPVMAGYTEQIERERRDLAFMRGLEEVGRRLGLLPPAPGSGPLPEPGRPEDEALLRLAELAGQGPITGAEIAAATAGLEPSWKRAALLALGPREAPSERD